MNKRFGLRYTATKITLLIVLLIVAALTTGCGVQQRENAKARQKNYWDELDALWEKGPKSKDWDMYYETRLVEPHGDSDGAKSYDQTYYVSYTSKRVDGFEMISFINIPAGDSRSLKERANGYFNLQTNQVEELPESEGFMKLVATEHKDLALTNFIEDGTLAQKYPGKRVYRLVGKDWDRIPESGEDRERHRPDSPTKDRPGRPFREDWPRVFSDIDNTSGPLVGYDDKTKKWETLEPGK